MQRLGVDFLNMLNQGIVPNLKGLRGFNLGGFVDGFSRSMAIPRYADGGLAQMRLAPASSSNRTPLLLQFNGGEVIDDVTIGNVALARLQREWVSHQLTSTGRKPRRL